MDNQNAKKLKLVVIGGGTGTSTVLRGLKEYRVDLSVIVTTADDGGSSGRLRKEYKMIPPGDARQCLAALATSHNPFVQYFNHRYERGSLKGHAVGNLIIAALYQKTKNFQAALNEAGKMLGAKGQVLPVSANPTKLCAYLADGRKLNGEYAVTSSKEISSKLKRLTLEPESFLSQAAKEAILAADAIIVGPGNFFSSIIPNFLVNDMPQTFSISQAKKIYVANLLTQPGHTDNFYLQDLLKMLSQYVGVDLFNYVIYNTQQIDPELYQRYTIEGEEIRPNPSLPAEPRFVGAPLLSETLTVQNKADLLPRTAIRHDPQKLAKAIMNLLV